MLTLADIDAMFPESHDGSVYSDLYKDVYGFRPRGISFTDIKDFDASYKRLIEQLNENQIEEEKIQALNIVSFENRISETMALVSGCNREHAIELIIDADDITEDFKLYGYSVVEWSMNIPFGYIKKSLEEA